MKLGSQKEPISLDDSDDVSSLNEDVTFSYRVPESDVPPTINSAQQTDFDSFSDAGSLREVRTSDNLFLVEDGLSGGESEEEDSDVDQVDDVEYGEDVDVDEDNMSNSASEMSSNEASDVEDDEQEDEQGEEEEEPVYRPISPELGNFEDETVPLTTLTGSIHQSRWDQPTIHKQYDPVRSSPAVVERSPAPYQPQGRTANMFTYGYPDYDAFLDTNFPPRSRWDVEQPVYSTAFSQQAGPSKASDISNIPRQPAYLQPLYPMSINSIVEPAIEGNVETAAEAANETTVAGASTIIKEVVPELVADSNSNSKRKRDEVDDVADAVQPPVKKATQAPPAPPARRILSPKTRRSTIHKAVVGATQAAALMTAGAVGTVAFLSSPLAESLIQWLG